MNPRAKRQKISDRVNVLIGVAKQPQGTMQDKSQPSFSRAHSPSQKQARRVRSKDRAGDGRLAGGSRWESHRVDTRTLQRSHAIPLSASEGFSHITARERSWEKEA